jgi:hypothetical protein
MNRFYTLLYLFFVLTSGLQAQFVQGDDPLGRPYHPTVGVLKHEAAPGVPTKVAELISIAFFNGLQNTGGAFPPYGIVNKDQLSDAVRLLKKGSSIEDLRKSRFWDDMVGVQYLLRLDVNSFEMNVTEDSVYDEKNKFVRVDRHSVASANLTARLVDVATSKVLMFNNFDVNGSTKGYAEYKTQTDSARALIQLNKQVRGAANGMIHGTVAGAALLTSIHQENKGKAEAVILNNAPITAPIREDGLQVYAVLKTYQVGDQTFRDAEKVGQIKKGKNYQASLRNFDVRKGAKKIADFFATGIPLICTTGSFPLGPFRPSEARGSLTLQDFKNTGAAPDKVLRILQDVLSETAASRPLLLDIVDRDIYDLIQKERELQQKTLSDATQAGISFGSSFYLNIDLLGFKKSSVLVYKSVTEEKPSVAASTPQPAKTQPASPSNNTGSTVAPPKTDKTRSGTTLATAPNTNPTTPAKSATVEKITRSIPDKYEAKADVKLKVSLVSVKTGELTFANTYSLFGQGSIPYNKDKSDQKRCEEMAFRNLASLVSARVWPDVQKSLTPRFHLLEVLETTKNGAETVLISGGQRAGFSDDLLVEVVEVTQEDVDGVKMDRELVIAELKITTLRPETSVCKVKSGGKELPNKITDKSRVYCRIK